MDYEIYVDMSLDIDTDVAEKINIRYVPMEYGLGDETLKATGPESDEKMHYFYESMRRGVPTRTSQITPYQYEETFTPSIKEGKGVLYIALSSGLSKTYEAALLAAQSLKERRSRSSTASQPPAAWGFWRNTLLQTAQPG